MQILDKMDESNRNNMQSMKKVIIMICVTFLISNLIIALTIVYKDYKAYDYEYETPEFENVNINGDSNNYGKDDN